MLELPLQSPGAVPFRHQDSFHVYVYGPPAGTFAVNVTYSFDAYSALAEAVIESGAAQRQYWT